MIMGKDMEFSLLHNISPLGEMLWEAKGSPKDISLTLGQGHFLPPSVLGVHDGIIIEDEKCQEN